MIILWLLKLGITLLIHNKDDIEFVTEFHVFWDTLYTGQLLIFYSFSNRKNAKKNFKICKIYLKIENLLVHSLNGFKN